MPLARIIIIVMAIHFFMSIEQIHTMFPHLTKATLVGMVLFRYPHIQEKQILLFPYTIQPSEGLN